MHTKTFPALGRFVPAPPPSLPRWRGCRHRGDCILLMADAWLFPPLSFGPRNPIMALSPGPCSAHRCYWVCPAPAGGPDLCPSPYQLQLRGIERQQSSPGAEMALGSEQEDAELGSGQARGVLWVPQSSVPSLGHPRLCHGTISPCLPQQPSDFSLLCGRILPPSCLGQRHRKQGGKWLAELQALSGTGGV